MVGRQGRERGREREREREKERERERDRALLILVTGQSHWSLVTNKQQVINNSHLIAHFLLAAR